MEFLVYSLLWVMQDFYHQPYVRSYFSCGSCTSCCIFYVPIFLGVEAFDFALLVGRLPGGLFRDPSGRSRVPASSIALSRGRRCGCSWLMKLPKPATLNCSSEPRPGHRLYQDSISIGSILVPSWDYLIGSYI